jgi:Nif-specific regulatory protein
VTHHLQQELEHLRRERDLCLRLLELGMCQDLRPLLEEALSLIVRATGAKKAYLALYGEDSDAPRFSLAKGCTDEELIGIRQKISKGIIAQAMATGEVISTPAAVEDPRFQENSSVQRNQIHAVLCAPVGVELPLGVLYLQERTEPGSFSDEAVTLAKIFSRHLAPLVDRLLTRQQKQASEDPTLALRRKLKLEGIVGRSPALAEALRLVESAARYEISVLLTGPSGTGKTAFARAIHENSPRAGGPFVELNCPAVPESLFEGELFGALPGAHSTATRKIPGKISAAQGGTLFLDEVGELSPSVQGKLLQLLQSKEYFPLGANKPEKADVRVIAATNADLEEAISRRSFREDLYYRLNVMPIRVPSLQERREDIAPLAEHFCQEACKKHGLPALSLSFAAARALEVTEWPGNIRQLANAVQAATIRAVAEESPVVELKHLSSGPSQGPEPARGHTFQEATKRFQRKLLQEALEAAQWNVSEAARRLGLTRVHVHYLIRGFDLRDPEQKKKP